MNLKCKDDRLWSYKIRKKCIEKVRWILDCEFSIKKDYKRED